MISYQIKVQKKTSKKTSKTHNPPHFTKKSDAIIPNKFQIIIFFSCLSGDYNVEHLYMWYHFQCQAYHISSGRVQSFLIMMWNLLLLLRRTSATHYCMHTLLFWNGVDYSAKVTWYLKNDLKCYPHSLLSPLTLVSVQYHWNDVDVNKSY